MSLEVLLIPLGLAAYSALKEHRRTDLCEGCKQTRIAEVALLVDALEEMGASNVTVEGTWVRAHSIYGPLIFQQLEGVIVGRIVGVPEENTTAMLHTLDAAVGALTQRRMLEDLRVRASQMGLKVVAEEIDDRGTVQLVFEEA